MAMSRLCAAEYLQFFFRVRIWAGAIMAVAKPRGFLANNSRAFIFAVRSIARSAITLARKDPFHTHGGFVLLPLGLVGMF